MRVAVVHNLHTASVPSGEDVAVRAEVAALRRAGLAVDLRALSNDEEAERPLRRLRGAWSVASGRGRSPSFDPRPDLVHVHNLFPYYGTRWLDDVAGPVVSTQHSYRPMCANGCLFRDGRVCTACPDGDRWAGTRYGCYGGSRLATLPLSIAGRHGAAADPILERSDCVLVLSQRSRDVYAQAGVPPAKLRLDAHFIPDDLVEDASTSGAGDHWLFVGRLSEDKGIDRLMERWPDDVPLRVIGDGPSLPAVDAATRAKDVRHLGSLPRSAVLDEMREAVGLVMPSLWFETFGLVYIEAISVGLPVMAFPPNVVADAVARDGTGSVAGWDDLDGAIARAAAAFPDLRRHCRDVFEGRYSEAAWVERRVSLYDELLEL